MYMRGRGGRKSRKRKEGKGIYLLVTAAGVCGTSSLSKHMAVTYLCSSIALAYTAVTSCVVVDCISSCGMMTHSLNIKPLTYRNMWQACIGSMVEERRKKEEGSKREGKRQHHKASTPHRIKQRGKQKADASGGKSMA